MSAWPTNTAMFHSPAHESHFYTTLEQSLRWLLLSERSVVVWMPFEVSKSMIAKIEDVGTDAQYCR